MGSGETKEAILKAYPYLEPEDVNQASAYAAYLAEEETVEFSRCDFLLICRFRQAYLLGLWGAAMTRFTRPILDWVGPRMR
jgi:hypothetical protein